MSVDVVDLISIDSCVIERGLHRQGGTFAFLVRRSDMAGIAAGPESGYFSVDRGSTCASGFELFDDNDSGSFREHKAVAFGVEWAAGGFWIFVSREGFHVCESSQRHPRHRGFGSTSD